MRKYIQNKGITLVSLIITVIILLILAGIGIGAFGGDSLLQKARDAREQAEIDNEKEIVETSVVQAVTANRYGNIEQTELDTYVKKNAEDRPTEVTEDEDVLIVEFKDSNRYYEVDDEGNVKKIDVIIDENPGNIKVGINGEELNGQDKPYEIWCIEDLVEFSENYANYKRSYIKLCKTLNFKSKLSYSNGNKLGCSSIEELMELLTNGEGFTPISEFNGNFDGQGFKIKNIYVNTTGDTGLFKSSAGVIQNLSVSGQIQSTDSYSGGIIGQGVATIVNCYNYADINGNNGTGGIVGLSRGCQINNCANFGNITNGNSYGAGGIVGWGTGWNITAIQNCYNATNTIITAVDSSAGGIIGYVTIAQIYNCYNLGTVEGTTVGGITRIHI